MALPTLSSPPAPTDAAASDGDSAPPAHPGSTGAPTSPPASRWHSTAAHRAGLGALLLGTAVLYLWSLSASGYGNTFYSAAVQAGSQSWKAFFFGSLDAGNAITVDKPPASLWLMALSVRLFGLSSWSILAPQALLGVATVGVLYASVRRTSGHAAALVAGALLAVTPAATLMFRFNNPDALLVFLLTLATYLTLRATEKASGRWLVAAGVVVGFAFLTKMLQAFLVLPAFALVYLVAAPTPVRRRILHLLTAFGAMIVALGWWVAVVELVPASWRPYVGGSTNNSILDLVVGYNGLGRIFGEGRGTGGVAPGAGRALGEAGAFGGGGGGFGGAAGVTRLFVQVSSGMITWLLPAALLLAAVALVLLRRAPRTDRVRAAVIVWTGSTVVTALTFSFMAGIYHDYYVVALAPSIAAGVAVAGAYLWSERSRVLARVGLSGTLAVTTVWAVVLLGRAPAPYSTLRWGVAAVGLVAVVGLLLSHVLPRVLAAVVLGLAVLGAGTGPAAYALNTAATPHQGSIVTAGPVSGTGFGGPRAGTRTGRFEGQPPGGFPGGAPDGAGTLPTAPGPGQTGPTGGFSGGGTGGPGGEGAAVSTDLTSLLRADASRYRWVAATTGSQSAASYQLATELPVMAIGGFSGGDPSPTLAQFQGYVADGQIHYYLSGGNRGGPGAGSGSASQIATWVAAHYTAGAVGGVTIYDLSQPGR
ncbi:MAG: glycosyltransferase family 39 protein [Friedmanniella sp.]|nr:glycosyltransferase family 39 protein [Friedmanniella sp.]